MAKFVDIPRIAPSGNDPALINRAFQSLNMVIGKIEDRINTLNTNDTAFVRRDGTLGLTAAWDAGDFAITTKNFVSDVITGTSPYACTSETLNSHLNADLLDGHHAVDFLTSVTVHDILSATHGDTLTGAVVAGDIIIGNATPKWSRLAKSTDGKVLTLASGLPSWESLPAETDPVFGAWLAVPPNVSTFTNDSGYLTAETDPVFSVWDKSTGISITEAQISDLQAYLTAETDPVFTAWDKSTGITITESQISDLQAYLTAESDPVFTAWDKSTGISITESQISDLQAYLTAETDPVFGAWDKSTGISITESQISDLQAYILTESDPVAMGYIDQAVKTTSDVQHAKIGLGGAVDATYRFKLYSADVSNYVRVYHDNTDAYFQTDDGSFIFQTTESTTTPTVVDIRGGGGAGSYATIYLRKESDFARYGVLQQVGNSMYVQAPWGYLYLSGTLISMNNNLTIGSDVHGTDYSITFNAETAGGVSTDGVITWDVSADQFLFSDDIMIPTGERIYFHDANSYITYDGAGPYIDHIGLSRFQGITMEDSTARYIAMGSAHGTTLAFSAEKMAFWGTTPVAQPAPVADAPVAGGFDFTGTDTVNKTTIGIMFSAIADQLNLALQALRDIGIIDT